MFEKLLSWDRDLLFAAPVWISLVSVMDSGKFDHAEREALAKLTHTRTFSAPKGLQPYYVEAEKRLNENIEKVISQLPDEPDKRKAMTREKIAKVGELLGKLEPEYGKALKESLGDYVKRVATAHHNVIEDFFIPIVADKIEEEGRDKGL